MFGGHLRELVKKGKLTSLKLLHQVVQYTISQDPYLDRYLVVLLSEFLI